jgi:hypothetical protein
MLLEQEDVAMRGKDFIPYIWTGRSDLDALLHPAQADDHPDDVANDPDLSLNGRPMPSGRDARAGG